MPYSESSWGGSKVSVRIRGRTMHRHVDGDIRQTISEQRSVGSRKSKMKEAKKRLKTLERVEKFRMEDMQKEAL